MPVLPLFSFVLLTAVLSTHLPCLTSFHPPSKHHAQRYFSCPYCLCFPLSCSLLPCPQSTFSPRFTLTLKTMLSGTFSCPPLFSPCLARCCPLYNLPSLINDTFPCPYCLVFQMSCSMLPSLYNLPSLNSFSRTL
jgi:hypothetical protein